MDRFDEQAQKIITGAWSNELPHRVADALRETWDAAIEECLFACVAKNHDGSIGNLVQHVRSLKSTPPRTNDATTGRATRSEGGS